MLEITVAAPPVVRADHTGAARGRWLPILALLLGVAVMIALAATGSMSTHGPAFAVFPVIMIVSTMASLVFGAGGSRSAALDRDRDDYLTYLMGIGAELTESAGAQRDRLGRRHPPPDALWSVMGSPQQWQTQLGGADAGRVRVGTGDVESDAKPVRAEEPAGAHVSDPVTETALGEFLSAHSTLPGMPVAVDVFGSRGVSLAGESTQARALLRAMVCQLTVMHSPGEVMVAAVVAEDTWQHWDWLKWLPHNRNPNPMLYRSLDGALRIERGPRHLVAIVDGVGVDPPPQRDESLTVVAIGGMEHADLRVTVTNQAFVATPSGADAVTGKPDLMPLPTALACARRMAARPVDATAPSPTGWLDLMGVSAPERINPAELWRHQRNLRIPIGLTDTGDVVELDIKEAAQNGMGPHGLCIGATGSGKSELLRTVALGMIAGHPPDALNLILVDFKGGATFLGLDHSRHVSAVITNLADEAHLVDRMQDALSGEITRRQQALRDAGNLGSVADYRRAREVGRSLPALPNLFVIVDEFSELLSQHPEFVDVFVAIGRLGRSLGVHLLLASQRLDEGRLRGLDSHLSYRICLKTLSASESRAVIGTADAYELPALPGAAYLKVGASDPVRFQSAFVSGPSDSATLSGPAALSRPRGPVEFTSMATDHDPRQVPARGSATLMDTVLAALADHGAPAHAVWLPPLTASPTLDTVIAQTSAAHLRVPIGLADRVFEQRRVPMTVDLTGSAGNVAVVGAPQTGKSAALRTLALSLATAHDPTRIQLYCLDFGGGGLGALRDLPHVGCVAGRRDVELVRRTVADLTALLRRREALFSRHGVDSIADYRRRRAEGQFATDDPYGDVFLIVDGWATLRQDHDGMDSAITALAAEGLSLGIHVLLSASRWADLRPALKDQIGTRIELRLADPVDSEIDRRGARNVPPGRPGQGLTPDGAPLTVALPRLDGVSADSGLADAATAAAAMLTQRYAGQRAPTIKVLPAQLDYDAVVAGVETPERTVILGVDEIQLATVSMDFSEQPHLLILGERGCGKTATLRTLARQLQRTARLIVVDPRRTMTSLTGAGHVSSTAHAAAVVNDLRGELEPRIGHASGRTSPVFLIIDDYEVLASTSGNPFTPVLELLPHARDIGLHMIIARRSAGAARALYEPVLAAVRESDALGLQMSIGAEDGPLLAAGRPGPLPPGRGTLIGRVAGERLVQVAWSPL